MVMFSFTFQFLCYVAAEDVMWSTSGDTYAILFSNRVDIYSVEVIISTIDFDIFLIDKTFCSGFFYQNL